MIPQTRKPRVLGWVPAALLAALGWFSARAADPLRWESFPHHRRAALTVPTSDRVGFTRMLPEITGLQFTNRLSDTATATNRILENGSGVALGDIDGDGWCDIYFCRLEGSNALYRNLGGWKFQEVTAPAGVACADQMSTGAVFADVEGDGDLDLFVTSLGQGVRLFINQGGGTFLPASESGLVARGGSTSMALADIDGDGDLELYVANYRTTTYKDAPPGVKAEVTLIDGKIVVTPEDRFEGLPYKGGGMGLIEKGEPDVLYVNKGGGKFGRIAWTSGAFVDEEGKTLSGPPLDWGLSVMFRDINGDGTPDLYLCNDFSFSRDRMWLNEGGRRFRAAPPFSLRTLSMSSMGVDFADINRDGWDDFVVVDMLSRDWGARQRQRANTLKGKVDLPVGDPKYRPEVSRNTLHLNRGDGTYAEIAQLAGLEASEWSWGAVFLDVDLDGYEDLLVTTGNNHDSLDADLLKQIAKPPDQVSAQEHFENLSKFPRLETPNLAFRNRGDLTFEEMGGAWGFGDSGISHGMALADLDLDGDLDVVMNNLHQVSGVYRNDTSAPRVAVKLRGSGGNTRGIGAKIKLRGGKGPAQSQEMIGGGRYLSGDDCLRVFAASPPGPNATLEVLWRHGTQTVISNIQPNFIYEVIEQPGLPAAPKPPPPSPPLFENISDRLAHTHWDDPFDDTLRQPALSRGLSRLGPGITWFDEEGDGWDDLVIGAGRGGTWTFFRNDRKGGLILESDPAFKETLLRDQTTVLGWIDRRQHRGFLAAESSYEASNPGDPSLQHYRLQEKRVTPILKAGRSSPGPTAMADIDGDGHLDLFVGGRVIPGRYPEPATSQVLLGGNDLFASNSPGEMGLSITGMISGALFADLDRDGFAELILACEWGPVRIFRNDRGKLVEATREWGLADELGWWNGVTAGDFDEDGHVDLCVSNWGRNSKYQRFLGQTLRLHAGDFHGQNVVDLVEGQFDPRLGYFVPVRDFDTIAQVFPELRERVTTYRAFGQASVAEVLGSHASRALEFRVNTLDSKVFLNRGGRFEARSLPVEAQFAPAFGVSAGDLDGDGHEDLFLAQNFFDVDPDSSRFDAGVGLCLLGDGRGGFTAQSPAASGIRIYGEQRGIALSDFDRDGRLDLAVGQNRAPTQLYHNRRARPGLRVRLTGPAGNTQAAGATLRWVAGKSSSPVRSIAIGSGYWSQDSSVQVLPSPPSNAELEVVWPGGKRTRSAIPGSAREIEVHVDGVIKVVLL